LRNYPDVNEVFDRDGADAMRWFLMSSPILRGSDLIVTEQGIRDGVRQVMIPLWNAWSFFSLYANAARGGEGYVAQRSTESEDVLDRYLLAKLRDFVSTMQAQMDAFEIANACDTTRSFLDVLTNWYIRRSRDRFWGGEDDSAQAAFDTLHTALETVCRVVAPLLPLTTEEIWRGLTGERSVHLTDWPSAEELPADEELVAAMDRTREICSTASALRKAERLRARLPLASLTVVTADPAALEQFSDLIRDEVNVKEVRLVGLDEAEAAGFGSTQRLVVNARAAGPRLGRDVQTVIRASKSGDWSVNDRGEVYASGIRLEAGEFELEQSYAQGREKLHHRQLHGGGLIALDTEVTADLAREGLANDLVRAVQQARRDAGLHVSDRISLTVTGDADVFDATVAHRAHLVAETLATQFGSSPNLDDLPRGDGVAEIVVGDGHPARVRVRKAS
ncbi:MAG: class I tRNA ligase family protein, partial [Lapillicoccus sp.]